MEHGGNLIRRWKRCERKRVGKGRVVCIGHRLQKCTEISRHRSEYVRASSLCEVWSSPGTVIVTISVNKVPMLCEVGKGTAEEDCYLEIREEVMEFCKRFSGLAVMTGKGPGFREENKKLSRYRCANVEGPLESAKCLNCAASAVANAVMRLRGKQDVEKAVVDKIRSWKKIVGMHGEVGQMERGLGLKLRVSRGKKIGLSLGDMKSKMRALGVFAQVRSGVYLVRAASRLLKEEIDHSFCFDADTGVILNSAEKYAVRLRRRTMDMCGMEKKGLDLSDVLMVQ